MPDVNRLAKPFAKILAVLSLSLGLGACSVAGWLPFKQDSGQALVAGEAKLLHFFTNDPNFDTGIGLRSGASYSLDIAILSNWVDSTIDKNENQEPLDEKGFADSQMPADWMAYIKRSRSHRWFELMLVQANCKSASLKGVTDLNLDEASGSYNFVAACDGKLSLFVNDSHLFYSNNVGYASITLSRLN